MLWVANKGQLLLWFTFSIIISKMINIEWLLYPGKSSSLHLGFAAELLWDTGWVTSLSLCPHLITVPARIMSPLINPAVRFKEIIISKCLVYLLRLIHVGDHTYHCLAQKLPAFKGGTPLIERQGRVCEMKAITHRGMGVERSQNEISFKYDKVSWDKLLSRKVNSNIRPLSILPQ